MDFDGKNHLIETRAVETKGIQDRRKWQPCAANPVPVLCCPQGLALGTTTRRRRIHTGREELLSEEHDRKVLIPEAMYAAIRHNNGKVAVYCADQFLVGHLREVNGTHVIDAARGVLEGAVRQAARAFQVQILQEV